MIRVREVRLIDDEGNQLGIVPTAEALNMAKDRDLDLVEVSPNAKTETLLWVGLPPANSANMTTDNAEPIAPISCLTVLLMAVASSILPDTTLMVQVTTGIKPKPAPIALNIWVIII